MRDPAFETELSRLFAEPDGATRPEALVEPVLWRMAAEARRRNVTLFAAGLAGASVAAGAAWTTAPQASAALASVFQAAAPSIAVAAVVALAACLLGSIGVMRAAQAL